MRKQAVCRVTWIVLPLALLCSVTAWGRSKPPVPDLTKDGARDDKHDWTLGPTGTRGWIWGWHLETTDARQILITEVDEGAPADGVLEAGDVILGVGGKPFAADCRKVFGRAITEAEKKDNGGLLRLIRWRDGEREEVELKLRVMGSYSDTAPWDCPKSETILADGCRYIAEHMKGGIDGKINALALLASGKKQYLGLVRDYAHELGPPDLELKLFGGGGMVSWHWGYANLFLTEYYLATGDEAVLPAIREYATKLAQGQSGVGSWGHGMAWPALNAGKLHGSLGGYGALNQAGLVCHLSLVLARKCGVKSEEVDKAIARANRFFGFYIGKGSIPYGDHRPGWQVHDDNGKNSIAAILFDLQGHREGTRFFSKMTVASYGERERGHTGNYFSFLWGPLGAARGGPRAAAAFLRELRWYFDLARRWDGSFRYQGGAGMSGGEHKYGNWDCTGAYMLAYALPLKELYVTGKGTSQGNMLRGEELRDAVEAGRGFSSWHMGVELYRQKSVATLLECLGSWSPAVRHRAAEALAAREADVVRQLVRMLETGELNARYGACKALGALKGRAAPAVPALIETLSHPDLWLRIQACYALAHIGDPAREAVPTLLELAAEESEDDPREFMQRYLCFCLFYPGGALRMRGLIAHSLEGVDRRLLNPAVKRLFKNPDGRARGAVSSIFKHLSYEEIKPLLPAIHQAIVEPAPSGVMFASGIRLRGLKLLAKHRIREGMPLCLEIMEIETWGKRHRITECLKILRSYGGAARAVLPQLRELEKRLLAHWEAKGLKPQIEAVRKLIADIEKAEDDPELRSLGGPAQR
ncbi:MAG: DUF6288 domain-containing protein [Planctomycetota bacterium]